MRPQITAIAALLAAVAWQSPGHADPVNECMQAPTPERGVEACTTLIEGGSYSGRPLAIFHNNRGVWHGKLGNAQMRLADYTLAISIDPEYPMAWLNRGIAIASAGDLQGGLTDVNKALELDPAMTDAYVTRGMIHRAKGDAEAALTDWREAIQRDGRARVSWFQLRMQKAGLYDGPLDGQMSQETEAALAACARLPRC